MATTEGYSEAYLHESRQKGLIAVIVLFIVLETLTLILRQVSKRLGRIRLDWDDLLITLGWVLCTVVNATSLGMSSPASLVCRGSCLTRLATPR